MTKVFISGSMQIKNLDAKVTQRIQNIIDSKFDVILGDADGVDSSIQQFLADQKLETVTIYCSGSIPRNNIGRWPLKCIQSEHSVGTRAYFTAKDIQLAKDCDYGLMIWDTKSTGTLSNVIELLKQSKKSLVFINKLKEFKTVTTVKDLEELVSCMSPASFEKAELKIKIKNKIDSFKHVQGSFFNE